MNDDEIEIDDEILDRATGGSGSQGGWDGIPNSTIPAYFFGPGGNNQVNQAEQAQLLKEFMDPNWNPST